MDWLLNLAVNGGCEPLVVCAWMLCSGQGTELEGSSGKRLCIRLLPSGAQLVNEVRGTDVASKHSRKLTGQASHLCYLLRCQGEKVVGYKSLHVSLETPLYLTRKFH